MPRLRAVRTKEEAAKVPLDQEVLIDVSEQETPLVTAPAGAADKTPDKTSAEPVVAPAKVEPPAEDEEKVTLKNRLKELEAAEKVSRDAAAESRRREEDALRRVRESQTEVRKERGDAEQARLDAIVNALGAAQSESEAAQRDFDAAITAGDSKAAGEATRRAARAEARIVQFEDAKVSIEAKLEIAKKEPERTTESVTADPFEQAIQKLPDPAKTWLRSHPEFITDPEKNAALQHYHWVAKREAGGEFTPKYFDSMEVNLGLKEKPKTEDDDDEPEVEVRTLVPSAPVSRESTSVTTGRPMDGKIRLSPAQREHARASGIDEVTYAQNLLKLQQLKKDGHYQ